MRKILTLALVLALPSAVFALATGDAMPSKDVKMKNVDGRELVLSEIVGPKGTLVIFSCNHCPFVRAWEDRIVKLGNEYSTKGIGVVAINANDPGVVPEDGFAEMQTRAKDKGFAFAYVVDDTSNVARAFGATRTPEAFLFDAQGKLVYHGAIDDNSQDASAVESPYLKDALDSLLAGKPIVVADTKSVGCTIKMR